MRTGRSLTALAALTLALALAACGGSANTARTTRTRTVILTRTTSATQPSRTATKPARTTGAATQNGACVAADLTPRFVGGNGAAGTDILSFALANTSSAACHTYGWPGVQFLGADGTPVEPPASRTTTDPAAQHPVEPTEITLKPGQEATFVIVISDAYDGGAGCRNASYLQIYAPDDTTAMRLAVKASPCPKSSVTPLQPGGS